MRTFLNNNRSSSAVPIDIIGHDATLNPYLCGTVQRRLAYALGRFADSIRRIQVRLADVHAPRGGDKSCQIEMRVISHDAIIVTALDARLDCAITKAAHAAARRLNELCKRRERRARQWKLSEVPASSPRSALAASGFNLEQEAGASLVPYAAYDNGTMIREPLLRTDANLIPKGASNPQLLRVVESTLKEVAR